MANWILTKHCKRRLKQRNISQIRVMEAISSGDWSDENLKVVGSFRRRIYHNNLIIIIHGRKVITAYENTGTRN